MKEIYGKSGNAVRKDRLNEDYSLEAKELGSKSGTTYSQS